jgi:hypothetical protein
MPLVILPPVILPPVILPISVIFCANAGVAIVIGLTVVVATIPMAAMTATTIRNSIEFIGLINNISYKRFSLYESYRSINRLNED